MRTPARLLVALAVTLTAGAAPACGEDLLVLRDGSRRSGTLRACVGPACKLDEDPIPRGSIAWIGFAAAPSAVPPATPAGTSDEVYLRNGSVERGEVVDISVGVVALASGSVDRSAVAWVRFAGAPVVRSTPPPEPTDEPVATPTPTPTPPRPEATPVPPPPTGRCGFWVGTLRYEHRTPEAPRDVIRGTVRARLREADRSQWRSWPGFVGVPLASLGSEISERLLRDYGDLGMCAGTARFAFDDPAAGMLLRNTSAAEVTAGDVRLSRGGAAASAGFGDTRQTTLQCAGGERLEVPTLGAQLGVPAAVPVRDGRMRGQQRYGEPGGWQTDVTWDLARSEAACDDPPPLPGADALGDPVLRLGDVFADEAADVLAAAEARLEELLARLQAGERAKVTIVVPDSGDPLFDETLANARREGLEGWFEDHGHDAGGIDWSWETGPRGDVVVELVSSD